jgi:hypothetical protein
VHSVAGCSRKTTANHQGALNDCKEGGYNRRGKHQAGYPFENETPPRAREQPCQGLPDARDDAAEAFQALVKRSAKRDLAPFHCFC